MEFQFGGLRSRFRIVNEVSVPAKRNGIAEWKVEIGDGVQVFFREALFPKGSFYGMQGNGLNNYETLFSF